MKQIVGIMDGDTWTGCVECTVHTIVWWRSTIV